MREHRYWCGAERDGAAGSASGRLACGGWVDLSAPEFELPGECNGLCAGGDSACAGDWRSSGESRWSGGRGWTADGWDDLWCAAGDVDEQRWRSMGQREEVY